MGPLDRAIRMVKASADRARARATAGRRRVRASGQMLVLFVVSIFVLTGITAVVVDISWYWANTLRVQRAADAAALAGVVWLPGAPGTAYSTADATATQNGYTDGVGGVIVTPLQDSANRRRLNVFISAPVNTFFMKIFGIQSLTAARTSKAEYILPVPMGSPENYYGNFGLTRGLTSTSTTIHYSTTTALGDSGWGDVPTVAAGTNPAGSWAANPTSGNNLVNVVASQNTTYAQTSTNNAAQQWSTFNFTSGGSPQIPVPAANQTLTIVGIQVRLTDTFISATCAGSTVKADLSWNNGAAGSWSSQIATPSLGVGTTSGDYTLPSSGGASSTSAWGAHTWDRNDFDNAKFQVRLTAVRGCGTTPTFSVDMVEVRVYWSMDTTTATPVTTTTTLTDKNLQGPGNGCTTGVADCYEADGANLNPRGFWATMNTEGAANLNGDAFQPYYDTPTSTTAPPCTTATGDRACYDADNYYNYAVEMPAGTTNGSVYVYDPVFCAVSLNKGTGDRWFGGSNGVTSMYELYNTQNTLYDITDDTQIATSGGLFKQIDAADTSMGGSGGSECKYLTASTYDDGRDYHDRWYRLYSGLTGGASGTVYRLHTSSTDPNNVAQQRNTNGESSFAIYASASGGTPRVYGLGAMQMFTPLSASGGATFSEFYLAQIDAVHAGKTMEIKLWDPGDTSPLSANIQIEIPTASGWSATSIDWSSTVGTSASGTASCNGDTGTGVTSIVTANPTSQFNGCWLTIDVVIPIGYTAQQSGWWKIKYNMTGSGTSSDVTTWKVQIKGNPVHLIVP